MTDEQQNDCAIKGAIIFLMFAIIIAFLLVVDSIAANTQKYESLQMLHEMDAIMDGGNPWDKEIIMRHDLSDDYEIIIKLKESPE